MRIVLVIGTRPEAIKMAPVIKELKARASSGFETIVVSTGQHREMMRPILEFFQIKPEFDLDLMMKRQRPITLFARVSLEIDKLLSEVGPNIVLVHGDTTSAAAAAFTAFHRGIKVGHVEAGLRTNTLREPFPEESNRRLITLHSEIHFAPTAKARANLIAEGIPRGKIVLTGNTTVDALHTVAGRLRSERPLRLRLDAKFRNLDETRHVVLVTGHRRENLGRGIEGICEALARVAERRDVAIVYPVHLNPAVRGPVLRRLSGHPNIHLIPPSEYVEFVYLMMRSSVIVTDSGGIQEEAPSLGKPVLVTRNVTERPEALAACLAQLVGTDPDRIVAAVEKALAESGNRSTLPVANPFGDGRAAERIVKALQSGSTRGAGLLEDPGRFSVSRSIARSAHRISLDSLMRKANGLEASA